MKRPGVLMVTGAYYPEVSGGGLQCRHVVRTLAEQVRFTVLTTAADPSLPPVSELDGVPVYRVWIDVNRWWSRLRAGWRLTSAFVGLRRRFDVVHLHGFSRKSALLAVLAKLFRKKLVVKLSLVGEDDPVSVRARGRVTRWCYGRADLYWGVSPRLQEIYESSGMPKERFWLVPNGVDLQRFRPGSDAEVLLLRRRLGLPEERRLILFVGLFARKKRPDVLFEAWARVREHGGSDTCLVFVGATGSESPEVDPALAERIRQDAHRLGREKDVVWVETTHEIESYYRAADLFVLPSEREGLPNALLEAMATGLPCVTSRLVGITDRLVDHGVNGLLVPPGNVAALEAALRTLLGNANQAALLGQRARETVERHYSLTHAAARYLQGYRHLARS